MSAIQLFTPKTDGPLLPPTRLSFGLYLTYSVVVSFSSMFIFAGHSRHFLLASLMYLVFLLGPLGGCLFVTRAKHVRTILANRYLWLLCILLFTSFDEIRFVRRYLHHPEIFSAAPALMEPARAIARGKDPYAVRLTDGAGISPGPGWIMLLAQLTLAGGAGLMTGLSTALLGWLIGKSTLEGGGFLLFWCHCRSCFYR